MGECIDLRHMGNAKVIAAWLLPGDEPAIVDCGPATCIPALEDGLKLHGLSLADVRHIVLTHIHLDHAGAAGTLVRDHPHLRVWVSGVGAPHVVDPSRLERSARRLYGESFDDLWGELAPVPQENVEVIDGRAAFLDAIPAQGHASHLVAVFDEDGACYPGDAAGVRISPARHVVPVSPPPDVDVAAWDDTIARIRERAPARLCLTHFGAFDDVAEHLEALQRNLHTWVERVHGGMSQEEFELAAEHDLEDESDPGTATSYRASGPVWQSYLGLKRYWEKREGA